MTSHNSESWNAAEEILLQFEDAWQVGEPAIEDFLSEQLEPKQRQYLLDELIQIDLDRRYGRGDEPTADSYFQRFPELSQRSQESALQNTIELLRASNDASTLRNQSHQAPSNSDSVFLSAEAQERYELGDELGRGTFAVVYRAYDHKLRRDVAIKLPRRELAEVADLRQRLLREARAAAKLQHQTILPIFEIIDDGCLAIVSELVDGETLEERIQASTPPLQTAVQWIAEIARGLHYAHQHGIAHRDIKPSNILMRGESPLIADFGLARHFDASETLTLQGDVLGTPAYMSPEQAEGKSHHVDARSDIYSVGAMLYRLITGALPFEGSTPSVLHQVQYSTPKRPRQHSQAVPRDLETVCLKCLEKEPAERYQSAAELADELERYLDGKPILASPIGLPTRILRWSRRHPVSASLVWLLLAALAFLAGSQWQLRNVAGERDRAIDAEDRAKLAEQETSTLLSESYLQSAQLAMQRGRFREALDLLRSCRENSGVNLPGAELLQLETHFNLGEFVEAERVLSKLQLDEHAAELSLLQGRIALWKAELSRRTQEPAVSEELFRESLGLELSTTDRAYAQAVVEPNSRESVQLLQQALKSDPFHYRARRMLVLLLLTLGETSESAFQSTVAREIYPQDPHFQLLGALVQFAEGTADSSEAILEQLDLSAKVKQSWATLYRLVDDLLTLTTEGKSLTVEVSAQITQLLGPAKSHFAVLANSGLQLPLPLTQQLSLLMETIANVEATADNEGDAKRDAVIRIRQIVEGISQQHPEGTLLIWLGELLVAEGNLTGARDTFLQAMNEPSLLRNHAELARLSAFVMCGILGLVHETDNPENLQNALQLQADVSIDTDFPEKYMQLFAKVPLKGHVPELCRKWTDRWGEVYDKEQDVGFLYHRLHLELLDQRDADAIKICDRILAIAPEDNTALENRAAAWTRLEELRRAKNSQP